MKKRLLKLTGAVLLALFFTIFLFLPLYSVVKQGFNLNMLSEIFQNHLYLRGMLNSCLISIFTTFLVFIPALPLAVLYDRYDFPGKSICPALMMAPMVLPPFVGAIGFRQLLSHYGVFNTILVNSGFDPVNFLGGDGAFFSVCVIEALHLYPILYLNLVTALGNVDRSLEDAARNSGAGAWTAFRRVTLPQLRPGIFAGGSIVLIWSFTELGTPLMFGFNTVMPVQVFHGITELGTNPAAFSLVLIMMVISCILYLTGRLMLGRSNTAVVKGISSKRSTRLCGLKKFLPIGVFLAFTFIAVLPHLSLILTASSTTWYRTILPEHYTLAHFTNALSDKLVVPSIVNSLKYSILAAAGAMVIGLVTSLIAKRSKLRFAELFDLVSMLPLMVPGLVIAVGYLGLSMQNEFFNAVFDPIKNPTFLIASAYAIRRLPYVVRAMTSGLEQTPVELEQASRNAGAGPFRTFLRITFPLTAANLAVGGIFAFSFSMMEVSDSLILAQKTTFYPVTKAIYELYMYLGSGPYIASAFGVWAMAFLAATLLSAVILAGKRIGGLFRM